MHAARCLPLNGDIPTIVLPHPSAMVNVASGTNVNTGIVIPPGKALIVLAPNADVVITIPSSGFSSYIVPCPRGPSRVVPPANHQTGVVLGTSTDDWQAYIELLEYYAPQRH